MKNIFAVCLALLAVSVFAYPGEEFQVTQTAYYEIYCAPGYTDTLARQMESRFALYNQVFRFDPNKLSVRLMVRAFEDSEEYNSYVMTNLGREHTGAVYLHYEDEGMRELVFCTGSDDGMDSISYQAFIQFLRAFIPNPPSWILEGFAVFFATVTFDENGKIIYEENLSWLDTVKNMKLPPLEAIMTADMQEAEGIDHFQALAWSIVSFFFGSNKSDYRSIVESFLVMSAAATAQENTDAVMNRIAQWNDMDEMTTDYLDYIEVRQTFNGMLDTGKYSYAKGKPDAAEAAFRSAMELRPTHYAPWYYLGLLAYDSGDTESAEKYYRSAMDYGADSGLVLYALGLNAAAAGKNNEAKELLRQSAQAAPRYKEKAEALILQLK